MVDALRSSVPGRGLVRLGRRGGRFSLPVAAGSGRRGEAPGSRRPAPPAADESGAAQAGQTAHRTREIEASTIFGSLTFAHSEASVTSRAAAAVICIALDGVADDGPR